MGLAYHLLLFECGYRPILDDEFKYFYKEYEVNGRSCYQPVKINVTSLTAGNCSDEQ